MASKEKVNLLQVIPCRSPRITTCKEGEETVLSFPRFKNAWINRYLLPKGVSKEIYVRLEKHGAAVWELIDGRRTAGEIIEKLAAHFGNEAGYDSRIASFLFQLRKDGFIKLTVIE